MDVLLYATENARNLGSIVRTSSAFGLKKIYLYDKYCLLSHEESVKGIRETSRGHCLEIVKVENPLEFILKYDFKFATTLGKGAKKLGDPKYNIILPENALIIFGGETRGLPKEISKSTSRIVIPTRGMDYCLSLPVAYGIVLYEFLRQNPNKFPARGS